MSNPVEAFRGSICDGCNEALEKGEDLFFHETLKLCLSCAEKEDIVCDCGGYKSPDFKQCYECAVY